MMHRFLVLLVVSCLAITAAATAQIKPVIAHVEPAPGGADFKFLGVPAPSAMDAATGRRFSIIDGEPDDNGGGVAVLTDGHVPTVPDAPDSNFFFAAGSNGGRLRLDLGTAVDIKQVNSYSWHTGTRAPQVYKLYVADGTAKDFNKAPRRGVDPATCGWNLLAEVDTRPAAGGEVGGQYGVSIGDAKKAIANCRYLLFDIFATERDDEFGNTFYSEIDVISDSEMLKAAPALVPPIEISFGPLSQYQATINTDDVPDLKPWARKLVPVVEKWYPILVKSLPSDGFIAPSKFSVTFVEKPGVAYTFRTSIVCAARWFKEHPDDQGAVVHEMVHVVQQYRGRGNPGWLVEGIADYFRWFVYEPKSKRPHPDLSRASYKDSYRTTAAFLNYVVENADKDIVVQLNAAMRTGKYTPDLWKTYTGKTVDELWADYVKAGT